MVAGYTTLIGKPKGKRRVGRRRLVDRPNAEIDVTETV
jgi:hypothetical protein